VLRMCGPEKRNWMIYLIMDGIGVELMIIISTTCVCILCVCVFYLFFSHTPKVKTQNLFFLLGAGGNIICKRDRWWVYWLLIVYTLLLPWQFSTLIYIFFRNVENF
jgi:hypothetical protein